MFDNHLSHTTFIVWVFDVCSSFALLLSGFVVLWMMRRHDRHHRTGIKILFVFFGGYTYYRDILSYALSGVRSLDRLLDIHRAFIEVGTLSLSPVREFLASLHDENYTYDELRMARLFLSVVDRSQIESQMLYESGGI